LAAEACDDDDAPAAWATSISGIDSLAGPGTEPLLWARLLRTPDALVAAGAPPVLFRSAGSVGMAARVGCVSGCGPVGSGSSSERSDEADQSE